MSNPDDYTVGWLCAIRCEFVAAQEFLDEEHPPATYIAHSDNNTYALGRIHHHNVAIAVLPEGEYGTSSAAAVARDMLHTFPNIKIGLMVGIGGGAPTARNDIRLGDVVVSTPQGDSGAVFEYDFGKTVQNQAFEYTKHLDKPPVFLRTAITHCRAEYERKGHSIQKAVDDIVAKNKRLRMYGRPNSNTDVLYRSEVVHIEDRGPCELVGGMEMNKVVSRRERHEDEDNPTIHYGLIASANQLMKDATIRDRLASEKNVLCFEMEAAGLVNHFPCLIIRGICDYSDSHKNDLWHGYAAMTAAAYGVDLLRRVPKSKVEQERKIAESVDLLHEGVNEIQHILSNNRQHDELHDWLHAPDPSVNHHRARKVWYEGTGQWLIRDPRYQHWKDEPDSFLWLSAHAGYGKTVLCSTIIEDLRNSQTSPRLIYFYFDFNDSVQNTLDCMIRALLSQCYELSSNADDSLKTLWKSCVKDKARQPTTDELFECLVHILQQYDQTWIVIDAVDESRIKNDTNLDNVLDHLKRLKDVSGTHTQILVTGRPEPDIQEAFSGWVGDNNVIHLHPGLVSNDIDSYIGHRLRPSGKFQRWHINHEDVLKQIKYTLMEKVDGMFRWAKCQLDSLEKCIDLQSLETTLSSLPNGLDETYARMIDGIPEQNKRAALTMLRLLAFSDRSLTLDEIVDALAVDVETKYEFNSSYRMPRPVQDICFYCPNLVKLEQRWKDRAHRMDCPCFKKLQEVRFTHFSVKEYLLSERLKPGLRKMLQENESRIFVAKICLSYLLSIDRDMSELGIQAQYPFARYCAQAWLQHAAENRTRDQILKRLVLRFLLHKSHPYKNWHKLCDPEAVGESDARVRDLDYCPTGLYYMCLHGILPIVESLLLQSVDMNARGGSYNLPLIAASSKGHLGVVERLLEASADANLTDRRNYTALAFAATKGYLGIAKSLIQYGARVSVLGINRKSILGSVCEAGPIEMASLLINHGGSVDRPSALAAACYSGYGQMVNFLLDKGANINAPGHNGHSPLSAAVSRGYLEIVTLLLDKGAQVIQQSREPYGPIYLAAAKGRPDIMEALLREYHGRREKHTKALGRALTEASIRGFNDIVKMVMAAGADVNIADDRGTTALHHFCARGLKDMVCTLIEHGADIDCRGNCHNNSALEAAVSNGHTDIAYLLIERGAQIHTNRYYHRYYCRCDKGEGSGALWLACSLGYRSLVQALLERGADVNSTGDMTTALQESVYRQDIELVRMLLRHGADPERIPIGTNYDLRKYVSETALYRAFKFGNLSIMELLMNHGASIHTPCGNYQDNDSVLEVVCLKGSLPMVSMFLNRGLNLNLGLSPACFQGHMEVAKLLMDTQASLNHGNPKYGCPLGAAAYGGHVELVQLLLTRGADCNAPSLVYGNALMAEAYQNRRGVVETLLDHGADPNSTPEGNAAWHSHLDDIGACHSVLEAALRGRGDAAVISLLVKRGADVNGPRGEKDYLTTACCRGEKPIIDILLLAGAKVHTPKHLLEELDHLSQHRSNEFKEISSVISQSKTFAEAVLDASPTTPMLLEMISSKSLTIVKFMTEIGPYVIDIECIQVAIDSSSDSVVQLLPKHLKVSLGAQGADLLRAAIVSGRMELVRELFDSATIVDLAVKGDFGPVLLELLLDGAGPVSKQFDVASVPEQTELRHDSGGSHLDALHAASVNRDSETVRILLQRGGNPAICIHGDLLQEVLPGYIHKLRWVNKKNTKRLQKWQLEFEAILNILLENGTDMHWKAEELNKLLIQVCAVGFSSLVPALIKRGADIEFVDETSKNPSSEAFRGPHPDTIWALLDNGAVIHPWMHEKRKKTLLHHAAENGRADIVARCINDNVDLNVEDHTSRKPLDYAIGNKHNGIVSMLLDCGAKLSLCSESLHWYLSELKKGGV